MRKDIVVFVLFVFVRIAFAESNDNFLRFDVSDVENNKGQVGVNLFRGDEEMFDNPYQVAYGRIEKGKSVVVFDSLPSGNYGAVAFHDENYNKILDHNFLGFPAESFGFSGDFEFWLLSGPPKFDDLKFRYIEKSQVLHVKMQ